MQRKIQVIAIVGPTASGKSALGVALARRLGGEVISADSRAVYAGMEITARVPTLRERGGVAHHLLGIASPKRLYSAGAYQARAEKVLRQIAARGHIPVVVGGTGFYIDSLLRGLSLPRVAPNAKLRRTLGAQTPAQLFKALKKLDPESARRIDPHNPARLVRAIEVARALGPIPPLTRAPAHRVLWIGLSPDPKKHERAIRAGVDARLRRGMLAEAIRLRRQLSPRRFRALGFEFSLLADYLDKKISRAEFRERLARGERRYAKRQLRWFTPKDDIHWVTTQAQALRLAKTFIGPVSRQR